MIRVARSVVVIAVLLATGAAARQTSPAVAPGDSGRVADQTSILDVPSDAAASLECAGCHTPGAPLPYLGGSRFHTGAHADFDGSVHAKAARDGEPVTCLDCHAADGRWETVFRASDPRSTVNRANVAATCAKCHGAEAKTFVGSLHGRGHARGIDAAASCADCHGAHGVFAASDPRSRTSRANLASTCAACHQSVRADYETSAHARALDAGDDRAPTCASCHRAVAHAPAPSSTRDFSMATVDACASCHPRQAPSYRDTFHGQATELGFKPAATCADCHTPHRNLPAADAASSVNPAGLVATCGRCHAGATASFVTYDPHADPKDARRSLPIYLAYTLMTLLFVGVFGFFGLHTLLWLQRSVVGLLRGEARPARDGERWVVRFGRSERATHAVMAASFLVLAATGLPLMFHYTGWGQSLARSLGGLDVTRLLHRLFAAVTFGYAAYHLGTLAWKALVRRERGLFAGPDSLVPRAKDLSDLYHMFRWFLYLDRRPPKFDRWTYWEKFDYFAVFWGVPVIGLSGLVLWLPNLFSRVVPGSFLNVATIVHGEEALLATGFIFAFHFFHNHMRPENFPLDTVVFTGRMPLARFEEERPEEYRRLVEEGRLDAVIADPPTPRARRLALVFGFAAYFVGLALVAAIFWSLVT